MAQAAQAVLAYTAGIIDGEGCISIGKAKYTRVNESRALNYFLQVTMAIIDPSVPDWLCGHFGGHRGTQLCKGFAGSTLHKWAVYGNRAADVLKDILPYLILKQEQARVAIEFQILRRHQENAPTDGDAVAARLDRYYLRLKELKKLRAPVETKPESTLAIA